MFHEELKSLMEFLLQTPDFLGRMVFVFVFYLYITRRKR